MAWLSVFVEPGYQASGTIMPLAFFAPTALVNALPWSGPAAATKTFGL